MDPETTMRIDDLRAALDVVLARVEESLGGEIDLAADHYWQIEAVDAFDLSTAPKPTVGQLSDDIKRLTDLAERAPNTEVYVWHDVAHLVGILRRIGALDLPDAKSG
jgi:hypothetical protein